MTQNKHVNLLLEVLGCFVSAAGIYSFAVASGVPVTGVAGVCAILYRLFGIPMGLSNVLINIPIILFSYKVLGKSFLLRSMRCMVLFAVFTDYLLPMVPVYTGDRLLATLCGGVICGIGDALIYMQNSSTGGIDFITMAVKVKHPHLPFGNLQGDRPRGGSRCHHFTGARRLWRRTQGCSALRMFQQAAVRDRARHPEDGPGQLYHHAAIQRGPWRRFPPAGTGQERRKYVITHL